MWVDHRIALRTSGLADYDVGGTCHHHHHRQQQQQQQQQLGLDILNTRLCRREAQMNNGTWNAGIVLLRPSSQLRG